MRLMDLPQPYPDGPIVAAARRSGRCLCGAVQLVVQIMPDRFGACHCRMCRRWGGGPLLSVDCGPDLSIEGLEHLRLYASSSWAQRAFCSVCGSHLFYRALETGHHYVPIGLLQDCDDLRLSRQIYIDAQPPYYARLAEATHDLDSAQMATLYGCAADPAAAAGNAAAAAPPLTHGSTLPPSATST
jgi:hypothetical protein